VVEISRTNGEITFSVTDDGVGLPAGRDNSPGLGFHIMNQRARSLGGRLEIKRLQGGGTRVALYLPQSK
jgi:signal transduction histidine kinase